MPWVWQKVWLDDIDEADPELTEHTTCLVAKAGGTVCACCKPPTLAPKCQPSVADSGAQAGAVTAREAASALASAAEKVEANDEQDAVDLTDAEGIGGASSGAEDGNQQSAAARIEAEVKAVEEEAAAMRAAAAVKAAEDAAAAKADEARAAAQEAALAEKAAAAAATKAAKEADAARSAKEASEAEAMAAEAAKAAQDAKAAEAAQAAQEARATEAAKAAEALKAAEAAKATEAAAVDEGLGAKVIHKLSSSLREFQRRIRLLIRLSKPGAATAIAASARRLIVRRKMFRMRVAATFIAIWYSEPSSHCLTATWQLAPLTTSSPAPRLLLAFTSSSSRRQVPASVPQQAQLGAAALEWEALLRRAPRC